MPAPPLPADPSESDRLRAELEFLRHLAERMASERDLQSILDWIVSRTTAMLSADEGSIKLLSADTGQVAKTLVRRQSPGTESGSWPQPVSISVMGFLLHHGAPLTSPDLLDDERFPGLRGFASRVRSVLAVPLTVDGRATGMLAVTMPTPGRRWSPDEVRMLSIVAANSAGAIEHARQRDHERQMQRLEEERNRELRTARDIQMKLVPSGPLAAGGWNVIGHVVPAREVGGDAFDYFSLEGGRLGVAIADVTGKGVPAALLMSNVQAVIRAFCNGRQPIPDALRGINRSVARNAPPGRFITFFYAELDPVAGELLYSNAGHNPPLLRRSDRSVEALETGGLPLGIEEGGDYRLGRVPFHRGDALLLYSDGVPEAFDTRDEAFGDDRLIDLWRNEGHRPGGEFIELLLAEVERFRGGAGQSDDITVVVLSPDAV